MTLGTIAVASHSTRQAGFEPLLLPFPKVPWDDPEAVVEVIEREGPDTIAGFIAEPITGAAGACLTASDDYWRASPSICHRHDILLITDEVMCGYGRTGLNFGFQHFPFEPDVIVGGKGLGGGYVPMGAVAAAQRGRRGAGRIRLHVLHVHRQRRGVCRQRRRARHHGARGPGRAGRQDGCGARRPRCTPSSTSTRRSSRSAGAGCSTASSCSIPQPKVVAEALQRDVWVYPAGSGPVPERGDGRAAVRRHRGRARSAVVGPEGIARRRRGLDEARRRSRDRRARRLRGLQRRLDRRRRRRADHADTAAVEGSSRRPLQRLSTDDNGARDNRRRRRRARRDHDATAPAGGWEQVTASSECMCADGSPYSYWIHQADPNKVVFFLQGGGACFDPDTCAFDSGIVQDHDRAWRRSEQHLERASSTSPTTRNPLADYSFVFAPYCTGDVHLGNATHVYGPELTIQHKGSINATTALYDLATQFPDATQLVVTGESAGSMPTPLYAGPGPRSAAERRDQRARRRLRRLSRHPGDQRGHRRVVGHRGGDSAVARERRPDGGDVELPGLFIQAHKHDPEIIFGRHDYAFDSVQTIVPRLLSAFRRTIS